MSRITPMHHGWARLPEHAQDKLDALVAKHGVSGAAARIGCSPTTIERIWGGGTAKRVTIERLEGLIARLQ